MYLDMYLDMLGIHVSEIETSPVPELTLVLMKIDLRQADNSRFAGVNHPCIHLFIHSFLHSFSDKQMQKKRKNVHSEF